MIKRIKFLLPIMICVFTSAWSQQDLYKEKYRPQFHFSPERNWMNDPNGLVYFDGEYHLFYQYNPYGNRWGHMTWAHSVSTDLVHWKKLPIAIPEENKVMIFSGSAVVDEQNTSGFAKTKGQIPLVAIYTGHYIADSTNPDDYLQAQYIAYSLDKGRTWKKYDKNPVLDLQKKDFRDPKVFWYAPEKKWVMLVVLPQEHKVQFYSSANLKQWTYMSEFGPAGDINDIWECPDLLQVPIKGEEEKSKWVLMNSQQVTMQYFVGEFDGTKFTSENPAEKIYRQDYGPDYYAGVTYNHLPKKHNPILLGWVNNWKYAQDIPTHPWKSAMAIPRELSLKYENNEWILLQDPVRNTNQLKRNSTTWDDITVTGTKLFDKSGQQLEISFELNVNKKTRAGVKLAVSKDNAFEIGYDAARSVLYMNRSGCSNQFNENFKKFSYYEKEIIPVNGKISLRIFFDNSIAEVFANEGSVVMTAQLFPEDGDNGIALFSENGTTRFSNISISDMISIWQK